MKITSDVTLLHRQGRLRGLLAIMGVVLALTGCEGIGAKEVKYFERPVEEIYNTALQELQKGRYFQAAEQFDEVERQHPCFASPGRSPAARIGHERDCALR